MRKFMSQIAAFAAVKELVPLSPNMTAITPYSFSNIILRRII